MKSQVRIECRGCRRVVHLDRAEFTPAEKARLRCSFCKADRPIVSVRLPRIPFTAGYRPP